MKVDGVEVSPANSIELLGVSINSKLSLEPHLASVASAARVRAAMIARLSHHLPRGPYLTQLAKGIVLGKVGYAIAAVSSPRLEGDTAPPSGNSMAIQVALNDVARSVSGSARRDHLKIPDLLAKASIPSYNAISVRAITIEAWKASTSTDGPNGTQNPLGKLLFNNNTSRNSTMSSRSALAGKIPLPLRSKANTFVWNATSIWNHSKALRESTTKEEAMRVAKDLAQKAPV